MQPNLEKQEYRGRENLSSRFFEVETVSTAGQKPLKTVLQSCQRVTPR
jgi:hypothetical protein